MNYARSAATACELQASDLAKLPGDTPTSRPKILVKWL